MRLTINGRSFGIEALAQSMEAHDQTLDTFSCAIEANSDPLPYAPMQTATVELDGGEELDFVVESDSVDLYSLNPTRYKHSITLIERARILAKRIVRNTSICQPAKKTREGSWSNIVGFKTLTGTAPSPYALEGIGPYSSGRVWGKLTLGEREKAESAWIQINAWPAKQSAAVGYLADMEPEWFGAETISDVNGEAGATLSLNQTAKVQFKLGATTLTYYPTFAELTGEQAWKFGRRYQSQYIYHLLYEGAYDISIEPQTGGTMITGTQDPYSDKCVPFIAQEIKWGAKVYYYTAYDVLNLLIERQKQDTDAYQSDPLFTLPARGELHDLLVGTIAPDFTFTQSTMYECVMEVFRLFDAVFTISPEGELGISYLNGKSAGEASLTEIGRNSALGEERMANGLISMYQDARQEEAFPSKYGFAHLRGSGYGVATQSDHNFIVAHPIQSVTKAEAIAEDVAVRYTYQEYGSTTATFHITGAIPLDVTPFVFEEGAWALLDPANSYTASEATQANSVCYAQGDDKIQCGYTYKTSWGTTVSAFQNMLACAAQRISGGGITGVSSPSAQGWSGVLMRAEYIASVDGRLRSESINDKCDGEMMADQAGGAVDLSKLSLNMMGLNMKMGEPTLTANVSLTSWANRIRKGQTIEYGGSTWIANVCSYQFLSGGAIKGTVSFVKDFNSLASRIRVKSERRFSEISSKLTQESEDNYAEYVYYTTDASELPTPQPIAFEGYVIRTAFYETFAVAEPALYLTYAAINRVGGEEQLYIPKIAYGGGNAICVEMQFQHPKSAGNQTASETGWFGATSYFTKPAYYTDDDGFMDACDIRIYAQGQGSFDRSFPVVEPDESDIEVFALEGYKCYKQPNEVFALNYQLVCLPCDKSKDFLNHHFMEGNSLCGGTIPNDALYLYYGDEGYSPTESDGKGSRQEIASVGYGQGTNYVFYVSFSWADSVDAEAWSICDSRGKVLFASNRALAGRTSASIIFATRHLRK